ncbi:ABC transporter ATP-binding protein [bacterium]|nr:ABC transporter ATP-binding protein [bacterium]
MVGWFSRQITQFRGWLFLSILFIPVVQGLRLLKPILLKWVLESVEIHKSLEMALEFSLLFLGAVVVGHVLQYFQLYCSTYAGVRIVRNIRKDLFDHILSLPYREFRSVQSGQLIVRLTSDVEAVQNALSGGLVRTISDLLAIVGILGILLWMNWQLSLYVIVGILLLLKLTDMIGRILRNGLFQAKKTLSIITTSISEMLRGMQTIKGFQAERGLFQEFEGFSRQYRDRYHQLNVVEPAYYGFVELSSSILLAAILHDGVNQLSDKTLSFAELVAFISYLQTIMHPIRHLSGMFHNLQNAWTSMTRIHSILSKDPEPSLLVLPARSPEGFDLEFSGVGFSYGEEPVLHDLNFKIREGESIGLVGRTGAGKSTIINLLNRFYLPGEGEIRLGGVPLSQIPIGELRSYIGLVLQDVYLFSGSIEENLGLFSKKSMQWSSTYIEELKAEGLVCKGSEMKPVLGNGENFSHGERQIIAFGRVFMKDAQIFLLDEATSNIDARTELFLQNRLEKFLKGKTSLIVAHRLSTLRSVDRILVLDQGRIVEEGSFPDLVKRRGVFYEYFRHQVQEGIL